MTAVPIATEEAERFAGWHGFTPLPPNRRWYWVSGVQTAIRVGASFLVAGDDGLQGIVGMMNKEQMK